MNSSEDRFERYRPQYPLPDELQKLDRSESVCKFCGVSYLIHNEIKKLEDELAASTKEAARFRLAADEAANLKAQCSLYEEQNKHLKDLLTEVEDKLRVTVDSKKDLQIKMDDLIAVHSCCSKEVNSLKKLLSDERQRQQSIHEKAYCLARYLRMTKDELINTKKVLLSAFHQCQSEHEAKVEEMRNYLAAYVNDVQQKKERSNHDQREVNNAIQRLEDMNSKLSMRISHLETEVETRIKEKQQWTEERNTLQLQLDEATMRHADVQKRCQHLSAEIDEFQQKKIADNRLLDDVQSELQRLKTERDKLCHQIEKHQSSTATLQSQVEYLERTCQEHLKRQDQNTALHSHTVGEMENLRFELARQKVELDELRSEREKMILAHQNRIEQLKESFQQKVADSPEWKNRMDTALSAAEARRLQDLQATEQRIKTEFQIELEIERQRQKQLIENIKKESQNTEDTIKLRQQLEEVQNRLTTERESLQMKLDEMSRKLNLELLERSKAQTALSEVKRKMAEQMSTLESEQVGKLKAEIQQLLTSRNEMQSRNQQLHANLQDKNDQIRILQDTVRRECEERFELMEALNEAKEKLHPGNVTVSAPTSSDSTSRPVILPALNAWGNHKVASTPQQSPPPYPTRSTSLDNVSNKMAPQLSTRAGAAPPLPQAPTHRNSITISPNLPSAQSQVRTASRGSSTSSHNSHQSAPPVTLVDRDPLTSLRPSQNLQKHEVHKRRLAAILSQKVSN